MVDKNLLLRKITELEESYNQLAEFKNISLDDYARDWKTQRAVERLLQISIEICSDITSHIISDKKLRVPKGYADSFRVLYENKIISKDLVQKLEKMTKFRNILVHRYDTIENEIVIGVLKKSIKDFLRFRDEIVKYISSKKK